MGDGHLNKCKTCTKLDSKKHFDLKIQDPAFRESEKKRGRDKYHRLYHGMYPTSKETRKRYFEKFPEIRKAHVVMGNIVKNRVKEFEDEHLHHWSYSQEHWRDVIPIREKDHYKLHSFMKYDQTTKKFISFDGEVLDTKEKHIRFIERIKPMPY
jgi:hypothetical protein